MTISSFVIDLPDVILFLSRNYVNQLHDSLQVPTRILVDVSADVDVA